MGSSLLSSLRVSRQFTTVLLMLCGLLAAGDSMAWHMFPRPTQWIPGEPHGVAAADLNNDGHMDSIVAGEALNIAGRLYVYLGHGDGTFTTLESDDSENSHWDVAVADFDHDGNLDVAMANFDGAAFSVRMGNGDGTFGPETDYPGGQGFTVSVGDFNGDGNPDVLGMVGQVLLGDGSGGFTVLDVPGNTLFAGVADFDGDGLDDYAYPAGDTVVVMTSVGDGFVQSAALPVGEGPYTVAAGDVSGDGLPDLVVGNDDSDDISVLLGNGDASFAAEQRYSVGDPAEPIYPLNIVIHDLDGDGLQDLIVNGSGEASVIILYGTGGGGFSAAVTGDGAFGLSYEIALADFNGDGAADLVRTDWSSSSYVVSWLFGDGNGSFVGAEYEDAGSSTSDMATVDLDGDGRLDLITANESSDDVSVLLGNGAGTFAPEQRFCVVAGTPPCPDWKEPSALAVGEFTGDAHLDLAVTNEWTDTVSILAGDGAGGFSFTTSLAVNAGMDPTSIAVGDLDNDDDDDLAVVGEGSIYLRTFLGNGDGTFDNPPGFFPTTVGTNPTSVALGHLDDDGYLDAAVTNRGSDDVSVLLGDGDGNFTHAPTLAAPLGPNDVALGDVNEDQLLDLVVASFTQSSPHAHILYVFLGLGDGSFGSALLTEPPWQGGWWTGRNGVKIVDMDGDGKQDVALNRSLVSVLPGDGTGVFDASQATYYAKGDGIAVGDFNLDSQLDLASAGGGVTVLLAVSDTGAFGFEADGATLRWPAATGALSYDIYRGNLADLVDGDDDGLPDGGYGTCMTSLDDDPRDAFFEDAAVPSPAGAGFFYLMSVVHDGGDGGLGMTSAGLPRTPGVPCP